MMPVWGQAELLGDELVKKVLRIMLDSWRLSLRTRGVHVARNRVRSVSQHVLAPGKPVPCIGSRTLRSCSFVPHDVIIFALVLGIPVNSVNVEERRSRLMPSGVESISHEKRATSNLRASGHRRSTQGI